MSERFEAWPHDAEGIVREALREYVSDGDGEDEKVLTAFLDGVRDDARREGLAQGWDEGYRAGADDMSDLRAGRLTFQTITTSPHRETGDGQ